MLVNFDRLNYVLIVFGMGGIYFINRINWIMILFKDRIIDIGIVLFGFFVFLLVVVIMLNLMKV